MAKKQTFEIAGVLHRANPGTLLEMHELTPLKAELRREPDNEYDRNAIAVYLDERPWKGFHLGYLPRTVAEVVAPRMDSGKITVSESYVMVLDPEAGDYEIEVKFRKPGVKSV